MSEPSGANSAPACRCGQEKCGATTFGASTIPGRAWITEHEEHSCTSEEASAEEAALLRRSLASYKACESIPLEALEAGKLGEALDVLAKRCPPITVDCGCWKPGSKCSACEARDALRALGRLP